GEKLRGYLESLYLGVSPSVLLARVIYPAAALLAIGLLLWRRNQDRLPALFLLGYIGLWLGAWATGPFMAASHEHFFAWLRMAPIALVCMALGAAGLDRGWDTGKCLVGHMSRFTIAAVVAMGIFESAAIVHRAQWSTPSANWTQLTQYKGYNYRGHFRMLFEHLPDWKPETLKALLHYQERDPNILFADIGHCYAGMPEQSTDPMVVLEGLRSIDPEGLPAMVRGMGPVFAQAHPGDVGAMLAGLDSHPVQWRAPFAEAIGYLGTGWAADQASFLAEAQANLDTPYREAYSRGMGARIVRILELFPYGNELVMRPDRVTEYIRSFPAPMVDAMLTGAEEERERNRL
ncbi:MAG: hypothetical protein P1V35_08900, partial [Planctomycetota bacterium]|nr:hypothetical protein [Planctomycetota bacterium]